MSGSNHIAGGVAFTGVFCSFWDVNIFINPWYLVATIFFSLLPDLDHSKAPISKLFAFTRLPQYLDVNFGHRTITHSLVVYIPAILFIYILEGLFGVTVRVYTLIFSLSYMSHLIFDMMTVSGVPLFFPFKKNPCVLPANPDYRLKSADKKSSGVIFGLFCGIIFFCFPLMKQGFWTSFNRSFGTLDHLNREYKNADDFLIVEYDYNEKGNHKKGKGLLIKSTPNNCILFDINNEMKVKEVLGSHTKKKRYEKEVYFHGIDLDSLEHLIRDKVVLNLDCQSTASVEFWSDKSIKRSKVLKLNMVFNPSIEVLEDTAHTSEIYALEIKQIELRQELTSIKREHTDRAYVLKSIIDINNNFDNMSLSNQENAVRDLKTLHGKRDNYVFSGRSTEKILKQIEQLQEQINKKE